LGDPYAVPGHNAYESSNNPNVKGPPANKNPMVEINLDEDNNF